MQSSPSLSFPGFSITIVAQTVVDELVYSIPCHTMVTVHSPFHVFFFVRAFFCGTYLRFHCFEPGAITNILSSGVPSLPFLDVLPSFGVCNPCSASCSVVAMRIVRHGSRHISGHHFLPLFRVRAVFVAFLSSFPLSLCLQCSRTFSSPAFHLYRRVVQFVCLSCHAQYIAVSCFSNVCLLSVSFVISSTFVCAFFHALGILLIDLCVILTFFTLSVRHEIIRSTHVLARS